MAKPLTDQSPLVSVQDYVNLRKLTVRNAGAVGAALLRAVADGHMQVCANEQDTWVTLGNGSRSGISNQPSSP